MFIDLQDGRLLISLKKCILQHCIEASLTVFIDYGSQKICLGVCLQNSIH